MRTDDRAGWKKSPEGEEVMERGEEMTRRVRTEE